MNTKTQPKTDNRGIDAQLAALGVSRESRDRLSRYVDVLLAWQRRINLIGPSTIGLIWQRHILDAAQLLAHLPIETQTIADLGSGAGVPGLVLALAGDFEAHLFESNGRKAAFLREAVRQTKARAQVHNIRLETLCHETQVPKVQVVVARALAPLPLLLDYSEPFLARGAIALFHKGQDVEAELTEATKYWKLKHKVIPSLCDSRGVILEIKEAVRG